MSADIRIGTAIIFAGKKLAFGNPVKVQLVRGSEIRNEMAFAVVTEEVQERQDLMTTCKKKR